MIDTESSTWLTIAAWLDNELAKAREANDDPKKDVAETAALRGRIHALKRLKALPDELEAARLAEMIDD
jgi:hypothetical protein